MANEKRLIDANALSDLLDVEYKRKMALVKKGESHLDTLAEGIMAVSILLGTMPTVDAVEVVHGRWNPRPHHKINSRGIVIKCCAFYYCSECGTERPIVPPYNYCPNCGAKMDGDGNV